VLFFESGNTDAIETVTMLGSASSGRMC